MACLASLVAAHNIDRTFLKGNVVNHKQLGKFETCLGKSRFNTVSLSFTGIDRVYTMSQDELLRQKFVLDILYKVQLPLNNVELFNLDQNFNMDENMFIGVSMLS